jgi:hypothetical protein
MYVVLAHVTIETGRHDEAMAALRDQIVPMVKGAPGFVRGTWFGNEQSGNGLVVFDSEDSARAMSAQVTSGPDDPVRVEDVQVYEVHAEA